MDPNTLFDHMPGFQGMLKQLLSSPAASQTYSTRGLRIELTDKQLGFAPISRRANYDVEASLILGDVLRECEIAPPNGGLPRVWSHPKKSELREIARLPKKEGWKRCGRLVAKPTMFREGGEKIWEGLKMFRVEEGEKGVMGVARGWRCFTEVPEVMAGCGRCRKGVWRRLRECGNVEREGEMWVGVLGRQRKRYGRIVGCMPVIQEEDGEDEARDGVGETGDGRRDGKENGGFKDSGVCLINALPQA